MATSSAHLNTLDPRSLADLQRLAKSDGRSDEALRAASRQIEGLFLQMMLKAMRDATPADGPLDSDQTRLAQELHDQQLASNLAQTKGAGLAEALFRQLGGGQAGNGDNGGAAANIIPGKKGAQGKSGSGASADLSSRRDAVLSSRARRNAATASNANTATAESAASSARLAATIEAARGGSEKTPRHVREFVASVWPYARAASLATGIPAHFMVAQAALETGWGRHQPKNADGTPSYNLFNIKASGNWRGRTTSETAVSEHVGGRWQREKAAFRAYSSYAEAFADYARLLTANPRYADVLGKSDAASFAQGLQNAGYATDPMYANKLMRIIGGNTLKNALATTA
ncbi:MAG: flagellar assembly peptidoglycan hydrolase FlgJ [Azoarcus sp.]|jgi:flagellar protein FlgJ|nr:flagellar assembly peptidoglycan hydrolase FlgJ [Azoarcus sp.]